MKTSWTLALEAENKSPRTIRNYTDSIELFVRWLRDHDHRLDPADVTTEMCRQWLVELRKTRSPA